VTLVGIAVFNMLLVLLLLPFALDAPAS